MRQGASFDVEIDYINFSALQDRARRDVRPRAVPVQAADGRGLPP